MKTTSFNTWLTTFLDEKGTDLETTFEVVGPSGPNWIPAQVVVEFIRIASPQEQRAIKQTLVQIDFRNGDVLHYFRYLANALAK